MAVFSTLFSAEIPLIDVGLGSKITDYPSFRITSQKIEYLDQTMLSQKGNECCDEQELETGLSRHIMKATFEFIKLCYSKHSLNCKQSEKNPHDFCQKSLSLCPSQTVFLMIC